VNRNGARIEIVLFVVIALAALIAAQNSQVMAQEPPPTPSTIYLPLVAFTPFVDYQIIGLQYLYTGYEHVTVKIQNTGNVPWAPPDEVEPAPISSSPWLEYPPWVRFNITDNRGVTYTYSTAQTYCVQGLRPGEIGYFGVILLDEHGEPYGFPRVNPPPVPVRSFKFLSIDIKQGFPREICD
jgi:hypothetical protein